ncbi:MAG: hypothetical protein GXO50_10315 [Chlorobi bacterium]|nr:hypothetical protein [Chlorobiota bacterium]
MKKKQTLILVIMLLSFSFSGQAQTMFGNTALTLSKNVLSLGVNPVYAADLNNADLTYVPEPDDLAYFFHLGYGINYSNDIGINIGKAWGEMYYGIDFENVFINAGKFYVSGTLGGHYWHRAGADVDLIASLKLNDFYLTSGIDIDIEPYTRDDGTTDFYLPAYVPVELEFNPSSKYAVNFELNIAVNEPAFTTIGAGINFYFK